MSLGKIYTIPLALWKTLFLLKQMADPTTESVKTERCWGDIFGARSIDAATSFAEISAGVEIATTTDSRFIRKWLRPRVYLGHNALACVDTSETDLDKA
jgi:hypothetical protein